MEENKYWEKRVAQNTWKTYNSLEEKNLDLLQFYIQASESIRAELYKTAEKYSQGGALTLTEMHKYNRLSGLRKKYEGIIKDLGEQVEKTSEKNMQSGFQKVYGSSGPSGDPDFSMPNKELMDKLLKQPWRGKCFSDRLWQNQKKLASELNSILLTGLQQGKTTTEIAITR